jgi:hypothetical protein
MPSWKRVIVSGSDASLNSLQVLTSVSASVFTGSFTGSLFGTASWAQNFSGSVTSASYAYTASSAISSSYAFTASSAISSSYAATASTAQNFIVSGSLTISSASLSYQQNLSVAVGSYQVIASTPTASYRCAFFDYVAFSGSTVRAGTLYTVWSGSAVEYSETYTQDIGGSTSGVILQSALSAGNIQLQATASVASWTIRSLIRLL